MKTKFILTFSVIPAHTIIPVFFSATFLHCVPFLELGFCPTIIAIEAELPFITVQNQFSLSSPVRSFDGKNFPDVFSFFFYNIRFLGGPKH